MGPLGTASRLIHVVILALWFGGCVGFALVFAPSVFQIVPSRDTAGNLVTLALSKMDLFCLIGSPILFLTLLSGWMPLGTPVRVRALIIFAMAGAVALSNYWLTPEMLRLRHAMAGPLETIAAADPGRVEFNRLHGYSTMLMGGHMLLALVLLVYAIAASTPKRRGMIEL